MKQSTLETLAPLLAFLRGCEVLDEIRPAAFHLNGRDFIHVHDDAGGLVADARLASGRVRLPVATPSQQAELIDRVEKALSVVASRSARGRR